MTTSSPNSPGLYADNPNALPVGTRLGEFELLSLLGVGGFGIVYLAFDHALEREVAVKEYMPAQLAGRTQTMHVSLRSKSDADTFALGLRSFVNEARLLARFDHPSLLKVYRFWEANGTAYMAMPVLRGRTVKEERLAMPAPPEEAWLRAFLLPILGALEKLHAEGVYHRDIAPDNIQIEPGGRPVLLDFGAARRVISDKSQTLTAILKPAYAPIEQYAEAGAVKQGPWTDIYALGATLHYLLLKRPPAPATTRTVHDAPSALTTLALPRCSAQFLAIIDWMLAPRPKDRPQNIAALRAVLDGRAELPVWRQDSGAGEEAEMSEDTVIFNAPLATGFPRTRLTTTPPAAVASGTTSQDQFEQTRLVPAVDVPPSSAPAASSDPKHKPRSKSLVLWGSALAGVLTLSVLAVMLWHMAKSTGSPGPSLTVATAPPPPSPTVAVQPTPAPSQVPTQPPPEAAAATAAELTASQAGVAASAATAALAQNAAPAPPDAVATAAAIPKATAEPSNVVAVAIPVKRPVNPSTALPKGQLAAGQGPKAKPPTETEPPAGAGPTTSTAATSTYGQPPVLEPSKPLTAAAPAPANPEYSCSGLPYFKHLVCMERQCLRAESQAHPDCQKWRRGINETSGK